jgi:hypothetical protein
MVYGINVNALVNRSRQGSKISMLCKTRRPLGFALTVRVNEGEGRREPGSRAQVALGPRFEQYYWPSAI